jgi:hypothetical protein
LEPAVAAQWATSISDPVKRMEGVAETYMGWADKDPLAANSWLHNSDLPEAIQMILEQIAEQEHAGKNGD